MKGNTDESIMLCRIVMMIRLLIVKFYRLRENPRKNYRLIGSSSIIYELY
jgi:hypothetical protein